MVASLLSMFHNILLVQNAIWHTSHSHHYHHHHHHRCRYHSSCKCMHAPTQKATECKYKKNLTHVFVSLWAIQKAQKMDPFVWIGCFTTRIMSVSALHYFCLIVIFHMLCFCFPRIDNMYIFSTLLRIVVNEYNYKYECKCHRKHSQQTNFNWHFSFQWWYFFCLFARFLFFSQRMWIISL